MKAAVYTAYGGGEVIAFVALDRPKPASDQVLIRVSAAPVTAGDARMRSGKVPRGMHLLFRLAMGWNRPRVSPGLGFSGVVAELGPSVGNFALGQKVFGQLGVKGGTQAEYCVVNAHAGIFPQPDSLNDRQAAAFFFGGLTAQHYLIDKARVAPGDRVLINGASGSVGSAAVEIATFLGAKVTAVCSTENHELVRNLGAHTTHDYRQGPVSGQFDVVLDVIGTLPWPKAKGLLAPGGRLCLVTADLWGLLGAALRPRRGAGRKVIAGVSSDAPQAMSRLVDLHRAGGYCPVIGQCLPFEDLRAAHEIAETFHKPGNLVVVMAPERPAIPAPNRS